MPMSDAWVANGRLQPRARLRLFCFPYAGGGALIFRSWPNELPAEIQVCPIQLPGRENRLREAPFARLGPLVEALAQALQAYMDLPYVFFGHSMGALISFELARALRRQGLPGPRHLFVSGRRAPQLPETEAPVYALPEVEFMAELRHLNGTPEAVLKNPELMQLFLPLLRADFAIVETYSYTAEAPLDCPLSAFGGLQDVKENRAEMMAWQSQTTRAFKLRMLPGDHFFLHSAQTTLLHALAQDLTGSQPALFSPAATSAVATRPDGASR